MTDSNYDRDLWPFELSRAPVTKYAAAAALAAATPVAIGFVPHIHRQAGILEYDTKTGWTRQSRYAKPAVPAFDPPCVMPPIRHVSATSIMPGLGGHAKPARATPGLGGHSWGPGVMPRHGGPTTPAWTASHVMPRHGGPVMRATPAWGAPGLMPRFGGHMAPAWAAPCAMRCGEMHGGPCFAIPGLMPRLGGPGTPPWAAPPTWATPGLMPRLGCPFRPGGTLARMPEPLKGPLKYTTEK